MSMMMCRRAIVVAMAVVEVDNDKVGIVMTVIALVASQGIHYTLKYTKIVPGQIHH